MNIKTQIIFIKLAFLAVLIGSVIFRLNIFKEGFKEGWNGTGATPNFFEGLIALAALYFGIKIIINLFIFLNSVQKENIFEQKNIKRLTSMGWSCVILSFLLYFFYFLKSQINFSISSVYQAINVVDFDFWLLIFGITMLAIGIVFKKGIELQQEQDLTI